MNVRSFITDNEALLNKNKEGSTEAGGTQSHNGERSSGGFGSQGTRTYWIEILVIILVIGVLSGLVYLAWR
jgi:hypothetical protein